MKSFLSTRKTDKNDFTISVDEVRAVGKLKPGNNDAMNVLSSDYFSMLIECLYVHLAFFFTAVVVHGIIPPEFVLSSIVPIPTNKLASVANSEALLSVQFFVKFVII